MTSASLDRSQIYQDVGGPSVDGSGKVLTNSIAFSNDKGGVGKTTVAANVAAVAAEQGRRVLVVDLDHQADMSLDLGVADLAAEEDGKALADAVYLRKPLTEVPLRAVRPRLDLISAGSATAEMRDVLMGRKKKAGEQESCRLEFALRIVADSYDLIVIDTPPEDLTLMEFALGSAKWVVAPTRIDLGSKRGLGRLGSSVREFGNDDLRLLGVILFGIESKASVMRKDTMRELSEWLGDSATVFETAVRHSAKASAEMRQMGWLAVEYAERLGDGKRPASLLKAAAALATDYTNLASEILVAFDRGAAQ